MCLDICTDALLRHALPTNAKTSRIDKTSRSPQAWTILNECCGQACSVALRGLRGHKMNLARCRGPCHGKWPESHSVEKNAKHALGVDQSSPVHKGMEAAYNAAKKLRQTMHKTRKVKATIADALWARRGDGVCITGSIGA